MQPSCASACLSFSDLLLFCLKYATNAETHGTAKTVLQRICIAEPVFICSISCACAAVLLHRQPSLPPAATQVSAFELVCFSLLLLASFTHFQVAAAPSSACVGRSSAISGSLSFSFESLLSSSNLSSLQLLFLERSSASGLSLNQLLSSARGPFISRHRDRKSRPRPSKRPVCCPRPIPILLLSTLLPEEGQQELGQDLSSPRALGSLFFWRRLLLH